MAQQTEVLVDTAAATRLDPTPFGTRRWVMIHNYGPNPIHLGFASTVASAKAIRIPAAAAGVPGVFGPIEVRPEIGLWAKADAALQVTGAATILSEW